MADLGDFILECLPFAMSENATAALGGTPQAPDEVSQNARIVCCYDDGKKPFNHIRVQSEGARLVLLTFR